MGGRLVFIGKRPIKSPSYKNGDNSDAAVKGIVENLIDDKNVLIYPAPTGDVIQWYGELQDALGLKPYVSFDKTSKFLNQSNYRIGEYSLYFIANTSLSEHISVAAEFQVAEKLHPWIWNPETGEKLLYPTLGSKHKIQLELPRATSVMIVFEPKTEGEQFHVADFSRQGEELSGAWQLQLNHIKGAKQRLELNSLADLAESEEMKEFAGEVIYEKTITIDTDTFKYIDLGNVQGISELTLNGKLLGTKWYGAHRYDLRGALKIGENKLSIKLTTIIGNYLKSLKDNDVAMIWTGHQKYYPMGVLGPVRFL